MKLGPWEIEGEIGRGGAGVVYRARGPDGRAVAVKVVHAARGDAAPRFEREARLQGSLGEAAGFVPVLDVGSSQGTPFIVMPFLPGGTLRARLRRGPLPVEEVRAVGRDLARALGAAHARGIVHRDVKPENVLFTEKGKPLLADLGLAKHFDRDAPGASRSVSLSAHGDFRGTIGYTAPEQLADAKTAGPPADVFSLGAVLYECLAGKPAFEGDSVLELVDRSTAVSFAPVRRLRPETPPALAAAVERALARDPRERFADALAFERALATGERRRSRRWLLVPGLALLLAAFVVVGARREPPAPPPPRGPGASELVVRAEKLVLLQDMAGAASVASEALALDPGNADAHALRAIALYYDSDKSADARAEAAAAATRTPRALVAWALLSPADERPAIAARATETAPSSALAWAVRAGTELTFKRFAEAAGDAERSLALERQNSLAWSVKGGAATSLGDYPLAVECFSKAVLLAPRRANNWSMRGQARYALKDLDEALSDAERAFSIDPGDLMAACVRGLVRYDRGEVDGAIADLSQAISHAVPNPRIWLARGVSRIKSGDAERALSDLVRAGDMGEKGWDLPYFRAHARSLAKDPARARADYEKGLASAPTSQQAEKARAWLAANPASADAPRDERSRAELVQASNASRARGDAKGALELATRSILAEPADARGWILRTSLRVSAGDPGGAAADAQQALDLAPGAETLALRGYVRRSAGDLDGALADTTKAVALDPRNANGFAGRSAARRLKGDLDGALADARESVRLGPDTASYVYGLANAEVAKGDLEAARRDFEHYLEMAPGTAESRTARGWLAQHPR